MNYILAISIESDVYKNPSLEFRLNDTLLDIIDITKNYPKEIRSIKKEEIFNLWGMAPDKSCTHKKGGPTMVDVLHSKKWILFEIDDANLLDENNLTVTCKNFKTNYTNGFVSKMDKCKILDVLFLPKKYFVDIKKIFQYCTDKNILADWMWCTEQRELGLGNGWPMIPALRSSGLTSERDVKNLHDQEIYHDTVWVNTDAKFTIIWDERLGLFRL